ncbi:MAG: hypothetical protein R3E85_05055 [Planctomycetota bacterium]
MPETTEVFRPVVTSRCVEQHDAAFPERALSRAPVVAERFSSRQRRSPLRRSTPASHIVAATGDDGEVLAPRGDVRGNEATHAAQSRTVDHAALLQMQATVVEAWLLVDAGEEEPTVADDRVVRDVEGGASGCS